MAISPRLAQLLGDRTKVLETEADILFLFGVDHKSDDGDMAEDDAAALEKEADAEPTERPVQAKDLSAMLILHRLAPASACAIGAAEHDQFYLEQDFTDLVGKATVEDILNLRRLGVFFDCDSMAMFA